MKAGSVAYTALSRREGMTLAELEEIVTTARESGLPDWSTIRVRAGLRQQLLTITLKQPNQEAQ